MPSLDTYAEYFPTYATGVVLVLVGIILGGLVERRAAWKRLEKRIDERFALNEEYLVEALEEYRHPVYEVQLDEEPLAPWERELLAQHAAAEPLASPEAYEGEFAPEERGHMWKGTRF